MFLEIGTRFPESPIPSRVLIAIGPGGHPGANCKGDTARALVKQGKLAHLVKARGAHQHRHRSIRDLNFADATTPRSCAGVEARLAEGIAKRAQAHRPAGRDAMQVAPAA